LFNTKKNMCTKSIASRVCLLKVQDVDYQSPV
jgi:hypothetical protein